LYAIDTVTDNGLTSVTEASILNSKSNRRCRHCIWFDGDSRIRIFANH